MKLLSKLAICAFGIICTTSVAAKTTLVFPGEGTLQAAIDNASNGDTLLLRAGTYLNSTNEYVIVDKSLLIRAEDFSNKPVIAFQGGYHLDVGNQSSLCGINITIQAVKIVSVDGNAHVGIKDSGCYREVNILQSDFDRTLIRLDYGGEATKRLIGNTGTNGSHMFADYGDLIYFAANIVNGRLGSTGSAYLYQIGNRVITNSSLYNSESSSFDDTGRLLHSNASTAAYIIGNEVNVIAYKAKSYNFSKWTYAIHAESPQRSFIANNKITFSINGDENTGWTYNDQILVGIRTDSASNEIVNNTVVFPDNLMDVAEGTGAISFADNKAGLVYQNILINSPADAIYGTNTLVYDIANNICFENGTDCGTENGNLAVDPLIDASTYEPLTGSPAINAGRDVFRFYDIDGTIGDIGLYGGPYGYEQFQSQIDATDKPYVYPIFHEIAPVDAETVSVQVMAVARMQ